MASSLCIVLFITYVYTCRWVGTSRGFPLVDGTQDVRMTMAELNNGRTTIAFTRSRVTDEAVPIDIPLNEPVYLLWATGTTNDQDGQTINYHGASRGASDGRIRLPSAVECPIIGKNKSPLFVVHISIGDYICICCGFAWSFRVTIAFPLDYLAY